MRKRLFLILFLSFGFCFGLSLKAVNNCDNTISYSVAKIDSVNNWYLIYVMNGNDVYKIASLKKQSCNCQKIKVGGKYSFDLQKRLENVLSIDNLRLLPLNYLDIKGLNFDPEKEVFICIEKGVNGLYTCSNLIGLCVFR